MNHLLNTVPYRRLLKGVFVQEISEAHALLGDFVRDELATPGKSIRWIAATAYALGIRQGVHKERARSKPIAPPAETSEREACG